MWRIIFAGSIYFIISSGNIRALETSEEDSLLLNKLYELYISTDSAQRCKAYLNLSTFYLHSKDLGRSEEFADSAIDNAPDAELKFNAVLCKLQTLFESEQFVLLALVADRWREEFETEKQKEINIYSAVSYLMLDDDYNFDRILNRSFLQDSNSINPGFNQYKKDVNKWKYRNAWKVSLIVPGSGQMILNKWGSGFNSLLLTGTIATVGIYWTKQYGIPDALLFTVFPFLRYYRGGIENCRDLAEQMQLERKLEFIKEFIEVVENKKGGTN